MAWIRSGAADPRDPEALESQGVTIFINSHLLAEVETFCRDVAILDKGKVALSGTMHDLTAGKGYRLTVAKPPDDLAEELRAGHVDGRARRPGGLQFATRELVNDGHGSVPRPALRN